MSWSGFLFDPIIRALFAALLGLVAGSFVSAISWRLPRDMKLLDERSCCDLCGHLLSGRDLIPLFSFLAARGKCRYCGQSLSWRYPALEIIMALLWAFLWSCFPAGTALTLAFLSVPLAALFMADLETGLLPDVLTFLAFCIGLFLRDFPQDLMPVAIGGVTAFLAAWALQFLFEFLLKKPALGFGDVKFLGFVGTLLPLAFWPAFLIVSGGGGIVTGLLWKWTGRGAAFPFGPGLILAFFGCLIFMLWGAQ